MSKNILIVIASLRHGGGAEKVATTLGTALVHQGYKVIYLTFYDAEHRYEFEGEEICLGEKLSNNPLIKFYKLFKRAGTIKKLCKKHKITSSLSFMEEANFSNILSKKLFHNTSRIVVSIRQSVDARGKLYHKLIKHLYNYTDIVVTVSREEKQNLIDHYCIKSSHIHTIYNPLAINYIQSLRNKAIPAQYKTLFSGDIFTFITMGRLSHQKNQQLLIQTFKKIYNHYPHTQLLVLGEGELRQDLEHQIDGHPAIYLLGNQSNPYQFLAKADCFVFPSRYEGFPNALLDTLACGLPIISSDCPTGPKEILRDQVKTFKQVTKPTQADYGLLTPVDDKQSLYNAMKLLYTDAKLRNHYKKKSLERARDFEMENIIKQWEEVL